MTAKEFFKYFIVKDEDGKEHQFILTPSQEEFLKKIKKLPKNPIILKRRRNGSI